MEPAVPQDISAIEMVGVENFEISFRSGGERVFATLCRGRGRGKRPAAVLVHGFGAFRDEFRRDSAPPVWQSTGYQILRPVRPARRRRRTPASRARRACPSPRDSRHRRRRPRRARRIRRRCVELRRAGVRCRAPASTRSTSSSPRPSAIASPMPTLPPVTTATLPLSPRSMIPLFYQQV